MDGHRPILSSLGVNGGEFPHRPVGRHHNPTFEIDEGAPPIGLAVLMAATRRALGAA